MPTTRFAPSPTGRLHVGHAFSAWFARDAADGGKFLLRIEDLDSERSRPEYVEGIYEDLRWLGLDWEGEVVFQSSRGEAYAEALEELKGSGVVYPCFCTRTEIRAEVTRMGNAPHGPDGPVYPGTCRGLSHSEREARMESEEFSWRLDMGKAVSHMGSVSFFEEGLGRVEGRPELFGDVVLARKDLGSSYHLSCVVDDALQGVDLVTRGRDLREATAVHRVLQVLLGLPEPEYRHHRLVVDREGKRLAKRADSLSIKTLREEGWTVERVMDFAAQSLEPA